MADGNKKHICLRTECGVCGRVLVPGASFVTLIADQTSLWTVLFVETIIFPDVANNIFLGEWLFCWFPNCRRCGLAPEGLCIHSDCYKLFKDECKAWDALDRLWIAAVSRSPWRGVRSLLLDRDTEIAVDLVYEKAENLGIPKLRLLPPELIQTIRDHPDPGTFWRYISVLSLSREISAASINSGLSSPTLTVPLCNISAWVRGKMPNILQSSEHSPVIRLTIDSRGLKEVERLSSRPLYEHWRTDNTAFAIQEESQLENVTAQFKYNHVRLELPENIRGLHIWDMPNPPSLEDCVFCGHIPQATRFRTIDLCSITGLTFFVSFGRVNAIHAHTGRMPYAINTFECLPERRRRNMAWLYLPLPKGDEIIAFGVRVSKVGERLGTQKPRFLVRTKLAGDIAIGSARQGQYKDIMFSQSNPRLLIYNTTDGGFSTIFGTYTPRRVDNDSSILPTSPHPRHDDPCHSSVPLTGVTRIRVFKSGKSGFCRAIILDYENGAQRAAGNCRLGIDPVTTYLNPARICQRSIRLKAEEGGPRPFWVESGCESTHHHHDGDGWVCSQMTGNLEFIMDAERHYYKIEFT